MFVEVPESALREAREVVAGVEQLLATIPPANEVPAEETRRARAEGRGTFGAVPRSPRAVDRTVPTPTGPVPVRVVLPEGEATAVYLHIHGGGWTFGAPDQYDPLLVAIADNADVAVVSVDYRLAPEHPFPAGPDDCEAAATWLLQAAGAEFGTERLLIGGESAGAHLAAVTLLRLRDRFGSVERFVAANLVFGQYDMSMTPSARRFGPRNLVISTPIIEWFADNFLPGRGPEERRDPSVSPLYADLTGMPPALFVVGDLDPLLDDSLFMHARWEAAGNRSSLRVYPHSPHGFTAFPSRISKMAIGEQMAFLVEHAKP